MYVCVVCVVSEELWWLYVVDECCVFDDYVFRNSYADVEETSKVFDVLVCE